MPKTGTSSIQESLFLGLSDPRFQYICFDGSNSVMALAALFRRLPENTWDFKSIGWTSQQIEAYKSKILPDLEHLIDQSKAKGAALIFSSEYCWHWKQEEFENFRNFMADRGYQVHVFAYIRPWKEWLESMFQQNIKHRVFHTFDIFPVENIHKTDYRTRIQVLEAVFGATQVQVHKYDLNTFPERCVVRHFCQQTGIPFDPIQILRSNDSLKLPALQFLYAYHKFGPTQEMGDRAMAAKSRLWAILASLQGPALRIHSSLIEPIIQDVVEQRAWLEQRLSASFEENLYLHDGSTCIREESDLFNFDPAAVVWLASVTGNTPVMPTDGVSAAQQIATQMHQLATLIQPENYSLNKDQLNPMSKTLSETLLHALLKIESAERWNSTIYYKDTQGDYNEGDKVTKKVNSASKTLSFKLRASKKIQSIRFDPLMDYVVVQLHGIEARLCGVPVITPLTVSSNAYHTENGVYYFDTQAPYFFIDFEGGMECEMDELVVSLRYEQYGVEALAMISEEKSKAIAAVNSDMVPLREKRLFVNPWQSLKAIVNTKWL
jgi:hypothetical protein